MRFLNDKRTMTTKSTLKVENQEDGKQKFTLEQLIEIESALKGLESISGFTVDTILKMSTMQANIEAITKPFFKAKNKKVMEKMLQEVPEKYEKDDPRFVSIILDNGARAIMKARDYIDLTKEFDGQLSKEHRINTESFTVDEFQMDDWKDVGDGKKKEKVKVTLINSGILKILKPFIEK